MADELSDAYDVLQAAIADVARLNGYLDEHEMIDAWVLVAATDIYAPGEEIRHGMITLLPFGHQPEFKTVGLLQAGMHHMLARPAD